jgi:hypothetical protein
LFQISDACRELLERFNKTFAHLSGWNSLRKCKQTAFNRGEPCRRLRQYYSSCWIVRQTTLPSVSEVNYSRQKGLAASRWASARDNPMSRRSRSLRLRSSLRENHRRSQTAKPCPSSANARPVSGIILLVARSEIVTQRCLFYCRARLAPVTWNTKLQIFSGSEPVSSSHLKKSRLSA